MSHTTINTDLIHDLQSKNLSSQNTYNVSLLDNENEMYNVFLHIDVLSSHQ